MNIEEVVLKANRVSGLTEIIHGIKCRKKNKIYDVNITVEDTIEQDSVTQYTIPIGDEILDILLEYFEKQKLVCVASIQKISLSNS